jgi:hypothetical protein
MDRDDRTGPRPLGKQRGRDAEGPGRDRPGPADVRAGQAAGGKAEAYERSSDGISTQSTG